MHRSKASIPVLGYGFQVWGTMWEFEIELIKLASAAQELIHTHKPLGVEGRDRRCGTLLVDLSPTVSTYSQSVHIITVHTVQIEGFR